MSLQGQLIPVRSQAIDIKDSPYYEGFLKSDAYKNMDMLGGSAFGFTNYGGKVYRTSNTAETGAFQQYLKSLPAKKLPEQSFNSRPVFRQPGDMGRYVAYNDPGQPGEGFSNYEEYKNRNVEQGNSMAEYVNPRKELSDLVKGTRTVPTVTGITLDETATGTQMDSSGKTLGSIGADLTGASISEEGLTVGKPTAKEGLGQIASIETVSDDLQQLGPAQAATQAQPTNVIGDIQGQLSPDAIAKAQTEDLDPKGTVKYQLSELMTSLEDGKPLPAWASPAVRKVTAIMNQRGMGSSSMAASAMIQAVMESGIPIASADAQAYQRIQLQNLSNKQATALKNAATVASMDTANLSAALTGAVNNARNFLAIDTKNLDNKQKANLLSYQSLVQGAFTDTAQENTRKSINAKTEVQVEEFYDELGSQVESANANRSAALRQFEVSEANALQQFNRQIVDSRDKFDANMKFAIDQSNVVWRREVNTANTAVQNETNRINVQNEFNADQSAINALWQNYRDNASFNFQKAENAVNRKHAIGLMALEYSYNKDLLSEQEKGDLIELMGTWVTNWSKRS